MTIVRRPPTPTNHVLEFSEAEMGRLRDCCQALGTTFAEFVHVATMQALDECEGWAREERRNGLGGG